MTNCQEYSQKLPFLSIWNAKHPNPFGNGHLCNKCHQPYQLVLEKYTTHLKQVDSDPKAATWVALCCLLAAQRVNLVRTITAVLCGFIETRNSWEVCRYRAIELAKKTMAMLPLDSEGLLLVKNLLSRAEAVTEPPHREIPIRLHASVMGDRILDIEHEAIMRSGISLDDLNDLVTSLPGHQWLLAP